MEKGLARPIGVVLFVICMVGISSVLALSWDCKGDCDNYYHDWHYNSDTEDFSHCTCNAEVKGDQESADFICVCHRERNNPDPGYWGYATCDEYGPLEYGYAYNHAYFYESSGGGYYPIGNIKVWIYTD